MNKLIKLIKSAWQGIITLIISSILFPFIANRINDQIVKVIIKGTKESSK